MLNKEQANKRVEEVMALTGDACGTFDSDEFTIGELELLTTENLISFANRNGCSDVEYVLNWRFRDFIKEQGNKLVTNEVARLLEEIKSKAETNTNVEFFDQGDTRNEFQDLADTADTAIDKLNEGGHVLEQALFQLNICATQIELYSSNELVVDHNTGNTITLASVFEFLIDHSNKA